MVAMKDDIIYYNVNCNVQYIEAFTIMLVLDLC